MARLTETKPGPVGADPLAEIAQHVTTERFSAGPIHLFEAVGRDTLVTLLQHGLRPDHKLLDFGCGALRLGYWLIRFLDEGNYYGIEPKQEAVDAGRRHTIGEEIWLQKDPTISFNEDCEMGVFGVLFDYVVARSVLTHTSPGMVRKILASFRESSTPEAVMLASYWPATGEHAFGRQRAHLGDELALDDWRFMWSVKYSFDMIRTLADEAGLHVSEYIATEPINGQVWLRFTKTAT
jgi:SAM-dependent methyltransferase